MCIQAGLPPNMSPDLYPDLARAIKQRLPNLHLHAFSPEEVGTITTTHNSSSSRVVGVGVVVVVVVVLCR